MHIGKSCFAQLVNSELIVAFLATFQSYFPTIQAEQRETTFLLNFMRGDCELRYTTWKSQKECAFSLLSIKD